MQHSDYGNVGIPVHNMLDCSEQTCIFNVTRCTIVVSFMEQQERVMMSVCGAPENLCNTVDIARQIIEDKIRFDACMQDTVMQI